MVLNHRSSSTTSCAFVDVVKEYATVVSEAAASKPVPNTNSDAGAYNAESIVKLEYPDNVRKRPGMFIGDTDDEAGPGRDCANKRTCRRSFRARRRVSADARCRSAA